MPPADLLRDTVRSHLICNGRVSLLMITQQKWLHSRMALPSFVGAGITTRRCTNTLIRISTKIKGTFARVG
jgi:hypothetical protein